MVLSFKRDLVSFFKKETPKQVDYFHIVKQLTAIRVSNYKLSLIVEIDDSTLSDMKSLILSLGNKILKVNTSSASLSEAQTKFKNTIEAFFAAKTKYELACFSGQLLQYYTIICDKDFIAHLSLQDFLRFLTRKAEQFGNVDNNLFVTEYKLIKIYNDLCSFTDSVNRQIAFMQDLENKLVFILDHLNFIKEQAEGWILEAPDNVFLHYLMFAINYSCAKAFELQYHISKDELDDCGKNVLSRSQEVFFIAAKASLEKLTELQQPYEKYPGSAFSLGQNVLIKLPEVDIDKLQAHVVSLI